MSDVTPIRTGSDLSRADVKAILSEEKESERAERFERAMLSEAEGEKSLTSLYLAGAGGLGMAAIAFGVEIANLNFAIDIMVQDIAGKSFEDVRNASKTAIFAIMPVAHFALSKATSEFGKWLDRMIVAGGLVGTVFVVYQTTGLSGEAIISEISQAAVAAANGGTLIDKLAALENVIGPLFPLAVAAAHMGLRQFSDARYAIEKVKTRIRLQRDWQAYQADRSETESDADDLADLRADAAPKLAARIALTIANVANYFTGIAMSDANADRDISLRNMTDDQLRGRAQSLEKYDSDYIEAHFPKTGDTA